MRLTKLLICIITVVTSCTAIPAYAQTPEQVVGAQLDRISAATKSADSATAALAAWAQKIVGTQRAIDSATLQLRAMLAALGSSTAQPPVVTTPPVVSPPPVVEAPPPTTSAYVLVSGDDYTRYASTAALQANVSRSIGGTCSGKCLYDDGLNGNLLTLDNTVLYKGHPTARYNQPSGSPMTPQMWSTLPRTLSSMWLKVVIRYQPGWTTVGNVPAASNAYKILGWAFDGVDGRGTIEYTNTNQYTFNWAVTGRTSSATSPFYEYNGPNTTTEWTDGAWYTYVVLVERTSSTTFRERWWLGRDNATPVLKATIEGRMNSGSVPPINRVLIGMNINRGRPQSQYLNVGEWSVVDAIQFPNPFGIPGL